ncbi:MAG: sigma-70 family RNA polymerase sigma factor [Janthinobacterium lividum]
MKNSSLTEAVNLLAIDNSEASYKTLFKYLFNPLKRFSFCLLKSHELAEEVASDVMFILWQRRTELLLINNLYAYSFVVARNLSLNIIKKNLKTDTIFIDDISIDIFLDNDTPEQILISTELRVKIEQTVNQLPPKGKLVFKLIKEDGLSYKDVAEILGISVKTVDAHLVSAIKKITVILDKEFNLV